MMLPSTPPSGASPVIRRGNAGWPVYALQTHLMYVGFHLPEYGADGVWGMTTEGPGETEKAVVAFQRSADLVADGVAGPVTQSRLVTSCLLKVEHLRLDLPDGLLKGLLLSEGGLMVAPVNWGVLGGVDCGPAQYRVYGPPYAVREAPAKGVTMMTAFSPSSIAMSATDLLLRRKDFLQQPWSAGNMERASRLAAFAHNWPHQGGADYYAVYGHVQNPTGLCSWLPRDSNGNLIVRFPDGVLVRTRQDWAEFYAMGGKHGEGMLTRFVGSWT